MREIKFRAWDNGKMTYNPIAYDEWTQECQPLNPVIESIQGRKEYPQVLMQFTGLKDRDGKEVYEGDLFGVMDGDKNRPNEYEVHGKVYFDTDLVAFCVEKSNGGWVYLNEFLSKWNEVIGNLYENPELLK